MGITPENLPIHELIGLKAEVEDASDEGMIGINGEIIDETLNTINIEGKKIPKEETTFIITLPDNQRIRLSGDLIHKRPEEITKMKLPKKWEYL